jgi:hypothetical protein
MSSVRQTIYLLLIIAIIAATGLSISKLIEENSHYTAPQEEIFTVSDITPGVTKNIDWETTDQLMRSCQIKVIHQKNNLEVTLRDNNGQIYQTTQAKLNDISQLAKKYQGPCDIIQTITE